MPSPYASVHVYEGNTTDTAELAVISVTDAVTPVCEMSAEGSVLPAVLPMHHATAEQLCDGSEGESRRWLLTFPDIRHAAHWAELASPCLTVAMVRACASLTEPVTLLATEAFTIAEQRAIWRSCYSVSDVKAMLNDHEER